MKRHLALALLLAAAAQNAPCLAANPPSQATAARMQARRYMPKWVYYDRLGLAAWNKGERPTAKTHWEYALSLAENDLRGRPRGALDKQTKVWINDLISHQTFLVTYYDQPSGQALRGLTAKDAIIKTKEAVVQDIDRKMQWFDKVESFTKMLVGRECYMIQDFRMLRAKQLMMQEQYRQEIADLKGEAYKRRGDSGDGYNYIIEDKRIVKKPAWWKEGAVEPAWRRDNYLRVGSSPANKEAATAARRGTTGTKGIGSMGRPGWWDKGDKPEIPGVSYVGGKQIKNDKIGTDGHKFTSAQGDTSTQWGQNPYTEQNKPNKWGTQAERDPSLDLNAKQKAPNWGENNNPKDTSNTGWGNNGGQATTQKRPDGLGEVNSDNKNDYWK